MKHLLFEHQNNISALKADGELAVKLQQDDARRREAALAGDKRSLRREVKEQARRGAGWGRVARGGAGCGGWNDALATGVGVVAATGGCHSSPAAAGGGR